MFVLLSQANNLLLSFSKTPNLKSIVLGLFRLRIGNPIYKILLNLSSYIKNLTIE